MKSNLKRASAEESPQLAEGAKDTKRRKRSKSPAELPTPRRKRSGSADAAAAGDNAADGPCTPASQLDDLFRDEDIAQLASDFPLPAGAAITATRTASGHGGGTASAQQAGSGRRLLGSNSSLPGRPPSTAVVTEEQLLEQRTAALSQLYRLYKREYWALMEELRTRHQQFCAAGGSALKTPGVTAMADSDEELSMRQLYRGRPASRPVTLSAAAAATPDAQPGRIAGKRTSRKAAGGEPEAALPAAGTECPHFSDVEDAILRQDPFGPARDASALLQGYAAFRSCLLPLGRLEECASAAAGREMDARAAMAALLGARSRFLIHRTCVILGRAGPATANAVDVDLAAEGDARKASRRAASITLHGDGGFRLRCIGRRSVRVNGREVEPNASTPLPHLSLLEAGRVRLLFCVNAGAVRRVVRRSRAITIRQDG